MKRSFRINLNFAQSLHIFKDIEAKVVICFEFPYMKDALFAMLDS